MDQQEPSMEEILSSIRRILSHEEDNVSQDNLKTTVSPSALEEADTADVMELTDDMRVVEEVTVLPEATESITVPEDMVLLSEAAVQASTDRLKHLVQSVTPIREKQNDVSNTNTSLEDLVSSLIRPYLKEWLDANLPALVERVVQKEVERLTCKVKQS